MKKQMMQKNKIKIHMYIWSLFIFSVISYSATIGMITFDVVERKALNQESQKIAAMVAKQEEVLSEKTKSMLANSAVQVESRVVAYISIQDGQAVGFAQ